MAKTTDRNGIFDVSRVFGDLRLPGLDVEAIAESQRKNLETLTQVNQLAVEGMRALAERQSEIVQRAFEQASEVLRAWAEPTAFEDRLVRGAEAAKQAFESGVANARELNDLSTKAGTDVFAVFARRISQSFDEVRLYAMKQVAAE